MIALFNEIVLKIIITLCCLFSHGVFKVMSGRDIQSDVMRMWPVPCVQQNKIATGPDLLVLYFSPKAQKSVGPPTVFHWYLLFVLCVCVQHLLFGNILVLRQIY